MNYLRHLLCIGAGCLLIGTAPAQTQASFSGPLPKLGSSRIIRLPSLEISERTAGSIQSGARLGIAVSVDQVSDFDLSRVSVRALRLSDDADLSVFILGDNRLQADPLPAADGVNNLTLQLADFAPFDAPWRLVIDGLGLTIGDCANSVTLLRIGGTRKDPNNLNSLSDIDGSGGISVNEIQAVATFGIVAGSANCTGLWGEGPLQQRIYVARFNLPPSMTGYGTLFVAADVPMPSPLEHLLFARDEQGAWHNFQGCDDMPAALHGDLQAGLRLPLFGPLDVSALVGTRLFWGFAPGPDKDTTSACRTMFNNGLYDLLGTIDRP